MARAGSSEAQRGAITGAIVGVSFDHVPILTGVLLGGGI